LILPSLRKVGCSLREIQLQPLLTDDGHTEIKAPLVQHQGATVGCGCPSSERPGVSSSRKLWKQLRSRLRCEFFEYPNRSSHVVVCQVHEPQMEDAEMPFGHHLDQLSLT
jgi:hypothetical protein